MGDPSPGWISARMSDRPILVVGVNPTRNKLAPKKVVGIFV